MEPNASLVHRCLADVLDVLTSTRDGLLRLPQGWHQDTGSLTLAGFWKLLCAVEAEIFRKTPQWATFHDNEEMVEWMRVSLPSCGTLAHGD